MRRTLLILSVLMFPVLAFAQLDPNTMTNEQLGTMVAQIDAALASKSWSLLAGLCLTVLVFLARQLKLVQKLPSKWVPWMAAMLATLGSAAVGLQQGKSWWDILSTGLVVGFVAVGGWETLGKALGSMFGKETA